MNNRGFLKTQHFKCNLSKPNSNKEDPHWCSVTRLPMVDGDHGVAELKCRKRFGYWLCVRLLFFADLSCCVKYLCPF